MASQDPKTKQVKPPLIFDVELIPCPPGTKSRARNRLPRGPEDEPSPYRLWWLLGGVAGVALAAGIVIGKFLLS